MRLVYTTILILFLLISIGVVFGVERFPPPEFESGYEFPVPTTPEPRRDLYEYLDVIVLLGALFLASYLAVKRRSRRGVLLIGIFSLLYFGFWRKGCVCSIGAIQNVTLTLFDSSYTIPIAIIAFFLLPLIFTLFFGRTFCAGVCPLGAIQDVVILRPVKIPSWLKHPLSLLPYIYLGAAVLFAATGSAFIICEYDPFIAFFRRSGSLNMLILGVCFLLIGMFIGRPYCRFLCPYGAILNLCSRGSKWHVNISSGECIQCRLCEDACPFSAIEKPTEEHETRDRSEGKKRLAVLIVLLPVLMFLGGGVGFYLSTPLSKVNRTVSTAERVWLEDTGKVEGTTDESDAFRETGKTVDKLYDDAWNLKRQFVVGSSIFGAFIGLVIGIKLIYLSVRRSRTDYEIDRGSCVSCGRCFSYCPIEASKSKEK